MSKRALEVDAVSTPSKRTTVRRAMSSNKRALDEILAAEAPAATTATTKKRVRKSTLVDEDEVSEAPTPTVPRRKPAVKVDVDEVIEKKPAPRRNTERLSTLLEQKNIVPSPANVRRPAPASPVSSGIAMQESFASPAPRASKKTPIATTAAVTEDDANEPITVATTVTATSSSSSAAASTSVPSAVRVHAVSHRSSTSSSASAAAVINEFWDQCREALTFCCATVYPSFLLVLAASYAGFLVTQQRAVASFAVVFTILCGLVLSFFFLCVVPFVFVTRSVEAFIAHQQQHDVKTSPVLINLLVRVGLLLTVTAVLGGVQYFLL